MAGLSDVAGVGDAARQLFLWSVLNQVISDLGMPAFTDLQAKVNSKHPVVPLSPADAAHAYVRSYMTKGEAETEAAKSGIDPQRFAWMSDLAGNAPSPTDLVTALRRGIISPTGTGAESTSFEQGIRETNLLDKWTNVVHELAKIWPTPANIVDATLKGQVTIEQGKADYEKVGGDPQWFDLLYHSAGSAPTPLEAVQMALRGIIGWSGRGPAETTYEQAFLEGPWRDKWQPKYQAAAYWYSTVSEAAELYRWDQISRDQAAALMKQRGLTDQQVTWWLGYAEMNAVTAYRGLTESAVMQQVSLGYITDAQAEKMLEGVHKGPAAIKQIIAYAKIQKAITSLSRAVDRVGTLYQSRKITQDTARNALKALHIPADAWNGIIADWDAVAGINVKTLTESQIVDAWEYQVMTEGEAIQELVNIGYTNYDAWVLLSVKNKEPLPNKPAKGPAARLGQVVPGTT